MPQQINTKTGEVDRDVFDRLLDLQGVDDVVMSVQIRPVKTIIVGTLGQFRDEH